MNTEINIAKPSRETRVYLKELTVKINKFTEQENKIDCFTQNPRGAWNKVV